MTAERRKRKLRFAGFAIVTAVAAVLTLQVHAATTERVVLNRYTGVAIDGYDPIAFFTDKEPLKGQPEIEATAFGATWRFRNQANRAFFLAAPEIYAPQFGGYDPMHVARGVPYPGKPLFWKIVDQRLYFFSDDESRAVFTATSGDIIPRAQDRWPAVRDLLAE